MVIDSIFDLKIMKSFWAFRNRNKLIREFSPLIFHSIWKLELTRCRYTLSYKCIVQAQAVLCINTWAWNMWTSEGRVCNSMDRIYVELQRDKERWNIYRVLYMALTTLQFLVRFRFHFLVSFTLSPYACGTRIKTNQISAQVEIVVQMENHQFPVSSYLTTELLKGINKIRVVKIKMNEWNKSHNQSNNTIFMTFLSTSNRGNETWMRANEKKNEYAR